MNALFFLLAWVAAALLRSCHGTYHNEWVNHGNGILNHRRALGPHQKITRHTVSKLSIKWKFPVASDVTATPTLAGGAVYFPAWNGMLYALKEETGELLWKRNLTELAGEVTGGSRASPVVWEDLLLVGLLGPAAILAVDRHSGHLVWKSKPLDTAVYAVITMSGTAYQGYYYVGVSSYQETEVCCTFKGSFLKLRIEDGSIVWQTYMLPLNSEYYGAAVWGSSPSIDERRRLVYIATGNNYGVPRSVEDCENRRSNSSIVQREPDPCLDPLNHQDSMLALSIDTGHILWSRNLQAYDVWTAACQNTPSIATNCPDILGPDYDFGEAPLLLYWPTPCNNSSPGKESCLVVAGQKSGVIWALDCDDGSIVWSTVAGPGGIRGGSSWGLSTDGERVYTHIINSYRRNFTLAPRTQVTTGGGWVAMEARTGKVLWSVAEPSNLSPFGPTSVSDAIVFGTSLTDEGDVFAFDVLTGDILWHTTTGAGIYGGASISQSCIFIGNGNYLTNLNDTEASLSAFCLPPSI